MSVSHMFHFNFYAFSLIFLLWWMSNSENKRMLFLQLYAQSIEWCSFLLIIRHWKGKSITSLTTDILGKCRMKFDRPTIVANNKAIVNRTIFWEMNDETENKNERNKSHLIPVLTPLSFSFLFRWNSIWTNIHWTTDLTHAVEDNDEIMLEID